MSLANINEETSAKQACAACKHQRKKCSPETCILHDYFPAEKAEDFNAVHQYFGVGNIIKNIKKLALEERAKAVESYVWAARAWNQNPNTGPLGLYTDVVQENQRLKQEIQQLKTATNQGLIKTENRGVVPTVNGNYNALVRVPIDNVTSYGAIPTNYHQVNGLYYNGQGGLDPNFGTPQQRFSTTPQQRFSSGLLDYQRGGLTNPMEITQNTVIRRDVNYPNYNGSDRLWNH